MNKRIQKILGNLAGIGIVGGVILIVFLAEAIVGGVILNIFGLEYDSLASVFFFFAVTAIIGFPFEIFAKALPKALKELKWLNKSASIMLRLTLDTIFSSVIMLMTDFFMDSIAVERIGILVFAVLTSASDIWIDKKEEDDITIKVGVISDIHNNLPALEAVIESMGKKGCTQIICCGDIVGMGVYPEGTIRRIKELPMLSGCVRGNHEDYLEQYMENLHWDSLELGQCEVEYLKWETERISENSRAFLKNLPCEEYLNINGKVIYLTHEWKEKEIEADVILYGHTHTPSVQRGKDKKHWYINSGSVGCPGEKKNIANAGILTVGKSISYENIEVPYNVEEVLEEMERQDMPDRQNVKKFFYGVEEERGI